MIKDNLSMFDMGGSISEGICDSCHKRIFTCSGLQWDEGQKLVYSPLLCESCGQKYNKEMGKNIKKIEELEKKVKELQTIIDWKDEKIGEVRTFLEGHTKHLEIRKEELLERLANDGA